MTKEMIQIQPLLMIKGMIQKPQEEMRLQQMKEMIPQQMKKMTLQQMKETAILEFKTMMILSILMNQKKTQTVIEE